MIEFVFTFAVLCLALAAVVLYRRHKMQWDLGVALADRDLAVADRDLAVADRDLAVDTAAEFREKLSEANKRLEAAHESITTWSEHAVKSDMRIDVLEDAIRAYQQVLTGPFGVNVEAIRARLFALLDLADPGADAGIPKRDIFDDALDLTEAAIALQVAESVADAGAVSPAGDPVEFVTCEECGTRYGGDAARCPKCDEPKPDLEDEAPDLEDEA